MSENGHCHCQAVTISVPDFPDKLSSCNCSLCSKTGWLGVYYHPDDVRVETGQDDLVSYVQGDRMIATWHCRHCGIATHWTPITAPLDRMGLNARMFSREVWENLPVEYVDGASF